MDVRTLTHPSSLARATAVVPLGTASWLLIEPVTVLGQTAAIMAAVGAAAAAIWLLAAYLAYHLRRRRYARVLAAEGTARTARWLPIGHAHRPSS